MNKQPNGQKRTSFDIQGLIFRKAVKSLMTHSQGYADQFGCTVADLTMVIRLKDGQKYISLNGAGHERDVTGRMDNPLSEIYFPMLMKFSNKMAEIWAIDVENVHLVMTVNDGNPEISAHNMITSQIEPI